MSNYRRADRVGGSYFFTVVTYRRRAVLTEEHCRRWLRDAIEDTRIKYPFVIDAWVLLPDHIHCIWTLPQNDEDFSTRWSVIKGRFSKSARSVLKCDAWINESKHRHRESTVWQRRFWEHEIRDNDDYRNHLDYIHYNPVKHGLAGRVGDWPFSTFHRYVREGVYPPDWGEGEQVEKGLQVGE